MAPRKGRNENSAASPGVRTNAACHFRARTSGRHRQAGPRPDQRRFDQARAFSMALAWLARTRQSPHPRRRPGRRQNYHCLVSGLNCHARRCLARWIALPIARARPRLERRRRSKGHPCPSTYCGRRGYGARVFCWRSSGGRKGAIFDPAKDVAPLSDAIKRASGVDFLIVDPVVSAVAGDSHKNYEVRRALQPLVDLASSLGTAVLGITHFSKGTGGRDPSNASTAL
jgi:AAA domain